MSTKSAKRPILRLCVMAMLAALAVVIGFFRFPIFAAVPFLEADFADLPILIATTLFGPLWGMLVLAVVSFIQAFMLGGNGWIGFTMHFVASGAMVLAVGIITRRKKSVPRLIIAAAAGTILQTLVMIPMSYIFYPIFGMPTAAVDALLFPYIIPFNLIKAGGSALLTVIIFSALRPFLKKENLIV